MVDLVRSALYAGGKCWPHSRAAYGPVSLPTHVLCSPTGFTSRLYSPTEDVLLPAHHSLGLTNLVDRPTSEAAELSRVELRLGVPVLLEKIRRTRPRMVCFVGKGIWDQFEMVVKRAVRRKGEGVGLREPEGMGSVRLVKIEEEDLNLQRMETSPAPGDGPTTPPASPLRSIRKTEIITPSKGSQATPSRSKTLGAPINQRSPKSRSANAPFDWDRPRDFKVTHEEGARVTLFWVVPSTSGLERTPVRHPFVGNVSGISNASAMILIITSFTSPHFLPASDKNSLHTLHTSIDGSRCWKPVRWTLI